MSLDALTVAQIVHQANKRKFGDRRDLARSVAASSMLMNWTFGLATPPRICEILGRPNLNTWSPKQGYFARRRRVREFDRLRNRKDYFELMEQEAT